jgi:predicted component of type VI protein secretion system
MCVWRNGVRVLLSAAMLLVVAQLVAGCCCCKVIPFWKCKPRSQIVVEWKGAKDCNDEHSVRVRLLILKNEAAFKTCTATDVFYPDVESANYLKLGIRFAKEFSVHPGRSESIHWLVDSLALIEDSPPFYLAVIAHFAEPKSKLDDRLVFLLKDRELPGRLNLDVGKDFIRERVSHK